jgi:hypothetical protein
MISVRNWRYEDATQPMRQHMPIGWYCNVYPIQKSEMSEWMYMFETWMRENCPSSEFTPRFNSGDIMYSVFIENPKEASLFQLRWSS